MNETKPKRGGAMPGAGRKVGPPTKALRIWLPVPEHQAAMAAGGAQWLKQVALEALAKLPK